MVAKRWQPEAEPGPMTTGNEEVHAALKTNSGKEKGVEPNPSDQRRHRTRKM
jgi:hypothetical protein